MILGTGIDITNIVRIEKLIESSGEKFIERIYTSAEQEICNTRKNRIPSYAKRYAAKEACAKALGYGIGKNALFCEIEVNNDEHGKPFIILHGSAIKTLDNITPAGYNAKIFLSLSDDAPYAIAHVIIEAQKKDS